jgi:transposase
MTPSNSSSLFPDLDLAANQQETQRTLPPAAKPRLRRPERLQGEFRDDCLDDLLPQDDPARIVWQFVASLDLAPLLNRIRAVEGHVGRDAIDPQVPMALWLMATIDGYGSARVLEELCQQHLRYQWICGGVSVNYHSLSDFRSAYPEFLDSVLTDTVGTLLHQGLIDLTEVAQDGMRVRAHAGASSFRREESLQECLEKAKAQVEALKSKAGEDAAETSERHRQARQRAARERLERVEAAVAERAKLLTEREEQKQEKGAKFKPEQVRGSTTDPEARRMKMADGGTRPGYNLQFATETTGGIIVGVDATNSGADAGQIEPMVDQIEERYQRAPERILVDAGFNKLEDIDKTYTEHKTRTYTPPKNEKKMLEQGENPYEPKPKDTPVLSEWRQRMGTEEAKKIYRRRAQTAEWVNAGMRQRGLYQVLIRGLTKVIVVGLWHAIAHNILRATVLRQAKEAKAS